MAPPKDIARSYPKRGLTADVGFRSEPKFCGDGSVEFTGTNSLQFDGDHTFVNGFSVAGWYWIDGTQSFNYAGFAGTTLAWGFPSSGTYLNFYQKATSTAHQTTGGTLTPKQWNHIAFTLSQDGLTVKAYLNGVELTITQPSVAIVLPSLTNVSEAGIASFQNSATSTLPYSGQMANQIWYDGVLTQDEVRQLMRAPNYAVASTIVTPQFYFELFDSRTDSTGNATTVEDRGTVTYGVKRPQLPRGLDLARGAAQARVYTGRAVDFDGSADYLRNAATVPSITGSGAQASICAWVKFDSTSGLRLIASFCNTANADGMVLYQNGTEMGVAVFNNAPTVREKALTSVSTGRWFFIVGTWDKDTATQKVYVDGVRGSGNMSSGIGIEAGTDIGARSAATPQYYFDGQIAGVKYFDVELTQDQIRELYHNPEQVLPTGVSASNLRRYYPLSDYNDTGGTGGRYFQDMGADGEPAEDQGSCTMAFAQPVPCPQLGLQQSATRLWHPGGSQGATATITAPGTTVSLSAWVLWDQARTSYAINLGDVVSSSGDGFTIRINASGQITMYQKDGGGVNQELLSGLTVTEGEWNHIVVATRSDSPYWRCWLNNSEASSPNALVNTVNVTSTNCNLGMNNFSYGMAGIANDAAVWSTELGDSDVAALYNSGVQGMDVSTVQSANLLGWWKFDDLTTLKDYSGNGANAAVTGTFTAASFPENASGSTIVGDFSMKRKGVSVLNFFDDSASTKGIIPAGSDVFPVYPQGGSFSLFFRMMRRTANGCFFVNLGGSTDRFGCYPTNGNGSIRIDVTDGTNILTVTALAAISDSEWHHVAGVVVYGSPSTLKIYIDGALSTSNTGTLTASQPTSKDVTVGSYGNNYEQTGPIACMKFYQTSLSDDEIEQIYRSDLRLIKGLANE